VADEDANKIMHITLPIGPNTLMGNDIPAFMGRVNENENRSKISIEAESKAEADHIYNGLPSIGEIVMPMED
jgi:PhnB protein